MTLWTMIEGAATAYAERVAMRSADLSLTYRQLMQGSAAMAARLTQELDGDGSPVVVSGYKEPQLLMAYLGALRCGHPYIPLDGNLPQHRVQQVLDQCGSRLLLTVDDMLAAPAAPPPACLPPADVTAAYIMFTSGTSGQPKGVVITHGGLRSVVEAMHRAQSYRAGEEVLLSTSIFSFDVSVLDIYMSLCCGGTVCCLTHDEMASPRRLFHRLAESGATVWSSTPTFLRICMAEPSFSPRMLPSLRRFLIGGETLPPQLVRQIWERFGDIEIWNLYGPTEAAVWCAGLRLLPAHLEYATVPIGGALPGMRVELEDGEIVIAGPQVSPGYLQATSARFFEWNGLSAYRSGDWGHQQDGLLFFDGRRDRQIKLRGHRVELEDVEANLRALPGIVNAAVLHRVEEEDLVAFVTLEQAPTADAFSLSQRWRELLAGRLPRYMVPQTITVAEAFPMTPNGKTDYAALGADTCLPSSRC